MNTVKKKTAEEKEYLKNAAGHAFDLGNFAEAADLYFQAEEFGKAAELFEWAKEYEKAALCYFKNQEYNASGDNYLKVSQHEKAAKIYTLGREFKKAAGVFLKLRNYPEAGKLYERAGAYFNAGEAFFLAHREERALENLEKANETNPGYLKNLGRMSELFLQMGQPQAVIDRLEPLTGDKQLDETNIDWFDILGKAYKHIGKYQKAKDVYLKILESDPFFPGIQQELMKISELGDELLEMHNKERYHKMEEVGRGAMGVVYKAEDLELKRVVALKILDKSVIKGHRDIINLFLSEAEKVAQLKHPNIVTVFDRGKIADDYFISMEFIEGITLMELIREQHPIPLEGILVISKKMFTALSHAHQKGIIHRDIKPGNIMINYENEVKVLDFSIAVLRDDLIKENSEMVLGTPRYMSPEQFENAVTDHRTDIYSAGVTLFHLVTGNPPFDGASLTEIRGKHLDAPIPPIKKLRPDTPAKLIRIIETCMAKRQEDRFPQASIVLRELNKISRANGGIIINGGDKLNVFTDKERTAAITRLKIINDK